jgi:FkbM family methyltransferase
MPRTLVNALIDKGFTLMRRTGQRAEQRFSPTVLFYRRFVADVGGPRPLGKLRILIAAFAGRDGPNGPLARLGLSKTTATLGNLRVRCDLAHNELDSYWYIKDDQSIGLIPEKNEVAGWTIVDGGANVGLFSLALRSANRIIAVEPNPRVCERLRWNLEQNRAPAEVIEGALSDSKRTLVMDFDAGRSTLVRAGNSGSAVEATTVDEILDRLKVAHVDLLKLDLEGDELLALKGAKRSFAEGRIERVYAEVNTREALIALDDLLTPRMERIGLGVFNALYVRRHVDDGHGL